MAFTRATLNRLTSRLASEYLFYCVQRARVCEWVDGWLSSAGEKENRKTKSPKKQWTDNTLLQQKRISDILFRLPLDAREV